MYKTTLYDDYIEFIQDPRQGFFSCCTVQLHGILNYMSLYNKYPNSLDTTQQFLWYKTSNQINQDIRNQFFMDTVSTDFTMPNIDLVKDPQFMDYTTIPYQEMNNVIKRFFTPSQEIEEIKDRILKKYQININNICVLFLRGNDKQCEIKIPQYDIYLECARDIYKQNPNIIFLVQSDENEFLYFMSKEFPKNHLILYEEIRSIPKNGSTTVDKVYRHLNPIMSKNFLAITYIMSQCKYVICNTGNCSLWIALFRGNADNLIQL